MSRAHARTRASPQREAILRIIKKNPGITVSELAGHFDLGWSALYHHLDKLRAESELRTRRIGSRRLLYPATGKSLPKKRVVLGKTARIVASAIAKKPGCSMQDLLRGLDMTPRMLYYHVDNLIAGHLVTSSSPTRYRNLRPTARLHEGLGLAAKAEKGARRRV